MAYGQKKLRHEKRWWEEGYKEKRKYRPIDITISHAEHGDHWSAFRDQAATLWRIGNQNKHPGARGGKRYRKNLVSTVDSAGRRRRQSPSGYAIGRLERCGEKIDTGGGEDRLQRQQETEKKEGGGKRKAIFISDNSRTVVLSRSERGRGGLR